MRKLISMTALVVLLSTPAFGEEVTTLDSNPAKIGYMMGVDAAKNFQSLPIEIDFKAFMQGLKDQFDGKELMLSKEQQEELKVTVGQELQQKQKEQQMQAAKDNQSEGEAFLAQNGKKEGVITTDSGLQYKVITKGDGPKPKATDTVEVHYKGTLINGQEFDSSYKRGQTVSFPLNRVIPGWTEGLQLMPVGSKYEFYIPSQLAYGERGAGQAIGPNSTLIFEVELVSIK